MSTIDFNSLARTAPLSLQSGALHSGLVTGVSRDSSGPSCNLPERSLGEQPSRQEHASPPREQIVPHQPLDAPLSEVAKLHTQAERSMSTGLSSAVARAVDEKGQHGASAGGGVPSAKDAKPAAGPSRAMHRVREVRREQGISIKRASQHLGVSVEEARRQEEPTTDLTMSQLFAWQKLCETPIADLLVEPDCELSGPVLARARMVRVMKTVQAIMERTGQVSVKRLAQTLVNQLVELMPELKGVSSWHAVERRQSCNQNARILESNYLRPADEDDRE